MTSTVVQHDLRALAQRFIDGALVADQNAHPRRQIR